jgi:hypothetical protein
MIKRIVGLLLSLCCLGLVSCVASSTIGTISTRNIDYSATYTKGGPAEASANISLFLFIPVSIQDMNPVEVVDMAMKKEGYDFLTNVKVSQTNITAIIYNSVTLKVEGTGWKKSGSPTSSNSNTMAPVAYEVFKNQDKIDVRKISIDPKALAQK